MKAVKRYAGFLLGKHQYEYLCGECGAAHSLYFHAEACCAPEKETEKMEITKGGTDARFASDIDKTLAERGSRYGDFSDHAAIAQQLQDVMRSYPGWQNLTPVMKQSLTVIADKQARILSGDPHYKDNWHDIQGYAKLAEDRCADTSAPQLPLADAIGFAPCNLPVGAK